MVALGGLLIGNECRWGTLLVQRPSRAEVVLAQAAELGVVTLVTAVGYAAVNVAVLPGPSGGAWAVLCVAGSVVVVRARDLTG